MRLTLCLALMIATLVPASVRAQGVAPYVVQGDAIALPLNGLTGDAERGQAIVADRQLSLCLLCHSGPFPYPQLQGNLAPPLQGAGARWSAGQLRLRIVDSQRILTATLMPAFHRKEGLTAVGSAWQGKPALSAQQVEDVVAFLATLRP
jgi:sulfur-oxidizing protein SoxX